MRSLVLGVALAMLAVPALAQKNPNDSNRYDVKTINFDLWCQETEGLPPDRCDKRLPEDDAKYVAYRTAVEKYEIPYLQRKDADQNLSRVIIHADPVPSTTGPSHSGDEQITTPRPNP